MWEFIPQFYATVRLTHCDWHIFHVNTGFCLVLKSSATVVLGVTLLMSRPRKNISLSAAVHTNAIDFVDNSSSINSGAGPQALVAGPPAYLQIDKVIYVPQDMQAAPAERSIVGNSKVASKVAPIVGVHEKVNAFMASRSHREGAWAPSRSSLHACADDGCCNHTSRRGLSARAGASHEEPTGAPGRYMSSDVDPADDGVAGRLSALRARLADMEKRAVGMSASGNRVGDRANAVRSTDDACDRRGEMSSRLRDADSSPDNAPRSTQSGGSRRNGGRRVI